MMPAKDSQMAWQNARGDGTGIPSGVYCGCQYMVLPFQ